MRLVAEEALAVVGSPREEETVADEVAQEDLVEVVAAVAASHEADHAGASADEDGTEQVLRTEDHPLSWTKTSDLFLLPGLARASSLPIPVSPLAFRSLQVSRSELSEIWRNLPGGVK